MTIENLKKDRELISKIGSITELMVVYEMDCQLEGQDYKLTDKDFCKLYDEIMYAYYKVEDIAIEQIVRCALDNKDKILNDDEDFSLRRECCWYV